MTREQVTEAFQLYARLDEIMKMQDVVRARSSAPPVIECHGRVLAVSFDQAENFLSNLYSVCAARLRNLGCTLGEETHLFRDEPKLPPELRPQD